MIVEDDEEFIDILGGIYKDALSPLKISHQESEKADIYLVTAKTFAEAQNILKQGSVYLTTVDINLSGEPFRGKAAEGMSILEEINNSWQDTCPIVVSSEEPGSYMRDVLRKYQAIDYIRKTDLYPKEAEIKRLLRNTFLYATALRLFSNERWSQAELIRQALLNEGSDFTDVRDLGKRLDEKKSNVTKLPAQEWLHLELGDLFRQDLSLSDWAIVLVDIQNFAAFQTRSSSEASVVLKKVADELDSIKKRVAGDSSPLAADLLLEFQESKNTNFSNRIFLGDVDNTGRFAFVTASQAVAEAIKTAIHESITREIFSTHYRLVETEEGKLKPEFEAGYFLVKDQKVGLMSASTTIITFSDIRDSDPLSDLLMFEERVFGHAIREIPVEAAVIINDSLPEVGKATTKKKRFLLF